MAESIGSGTVKCKIPSRDSQDILVKDCLYVLELANNRISVRVRMKKGMITSFGEKCYIRQKGQLIVTDKVHQDLYVLET